MAMQSVSGAVVADSSSSLLAREIYRWHGISPTVAQTISACAPGCGGPARRLQPGVPRRLTMEDVFHPLDCCPAKALTWQLGKYDWLSIPSSTTVPTAFLGWCPCGSQVHHSQESGCGNSQPGVQSSEGTDRHRPGRPLSGSRAVTLSSSTSFWLIHLPGYSPCWTPRRPPLAPQLRHRLSSGDGLSAYELGTRSATTQPLGPG